VARDADIRREMAQAIPIYAGVEGLAKEGEWIQWGGERLHEGTFARMPGGRARLHARLGAEDRDPPGRFYLTTRRGKQFNSMAQGGRDRLMGSRGRDDVLMNPPMPHSSGYATAIRCGSGPKWARGWASRARHR